MRLRNAQLGVSVTRGSAQLPMMPSVPISAMKVMKIEAPSSAPMSGRKESERNSKKLSTQANFPRIPPARAAALTSSLEAALAPMSFISGSAMMLSYIDCTVPPMMIW